jgi:hypothetical protein
LLGADAVYDPLIDDSPAPLKVMFDLYEKEEVVTPASAFSQRDRPD